MKGLAFLLTIILALCVSTAPAQTAATIPAWVQPGLVVAYDGVSAFVRNGRFSQGIRVVMTTRVTSVSGNKVSGVTQVQTVGSPIGGRHSWTCTAAGNCISDMGGFSGKFWVDPAHPTDSVRGPNGEPFSVVGRGPYSYGGRSWSGVTLTYQNPATGWQYLLIFDSNTGLILAYSENSPGQQVHTYFRSISRR